MKFAAVVLIALWSSLQVSAAHSGQVSPAEQSVLSRVTITVLDRRRSPVLEDSWRLSGDDVDDSWSPAGRTTATSLAFFPFVVYVKVILEDGVTIRHCAGAILTAVHVVTSAYCVATASSVQVAVGSLDADAPAQSSYGRPTIHPGYRKHSLVNDVAVVRLLTSLLFSNVVFPIKLPQNSFQVTENTLNEITLRTFGWQQDSGGGRTLRYVEMAQVPRFVCLAKTLEVWIEYANTHSCIDTEFKTKAMCIGDRGAPVTHTLKGDNTPALVGVLSDYTECPSRYPFAFTRIGPVLNWLTNAIKL